MLGVRPENGVDLRLGPNVIRALDFDGGLGGIGNAVGVLGRVETAARAGHVAENVVERAARGLGVELVT